MYTTYTLYADRNFRKQAAIAGLSACFEKNTLFSKKTRTLYLVCNFYEEEDSKPKTCTFSDLPTLSYFERLCGSLWSFKPLIFVLAHLHFFWDLLF